MDTTKTAIDIQAQALFDAYVNKGANAARILFDAYCSKLKHFEAVALRERFHVLKSEKVPTR